MFHALSNIDVAIAACLILINGAISIALKLGLEKKLAWASFRTIVQLTLIGFVLEWIFALQSWPIILGIGVMMTTIAAFSAVGRVEHQLPLMKMNSLISVFSSSWLVTAITLFAVIGYEGWKDYPAQYVIPFLGLVLGNTLNGISLGMDKLGDQLKRRRGEIELILSLGGSRWEAGQSSVRSAIRTGMIPILNSMMVVGLVSLPGVMTGQLLAGASPVDAVKYQIVIMFIIAAGTAMGTISVVLLSYHRVFNNMHQFLFDEIQSN
ncbi:MAG: iron export ABC transporter permease subunit FetB [Planctomycetaceae bacterium]|nr:iron export ABC transporter permease subunit FetB [Planctomycetaceae bacterium]